MNDVISSCAWNVRSFECYKDWTLLSVRFELHLLAHALKKDVNDPERPGFVENHLAFYYNKYFKKAFNVKMFGVKDNASLVDFIKDTIKIDVFLWDLL